MHNIEVLRQHYYCAPILPVYKSELSDEMQLRLTNRVCPLCLEPFFDDEELIILSYIKDGKQELFVMHTECMEVHHGKKRKV